MGIDEIRSRRCVLSESKSEERMVRDGKEGIVRWENRGEPNVKFKKIQGDSKVSIRGENGPFVYGNAVYGHRYKVV
jgi:hypothetical protein